MDAAREPWRCRGTRQPTARERRGGPVRVAERPYHQGSRATPAEGRGRSSKAAHDGGPDVTTGEGAYQLRTCSATSDGATYESEGTPGFRFYSLSGKVWRADVLAVAWQAVRRNGGAAGVDGETVADIERSGWSGRWEHWRGT